MALFATARKANHPGLSHRWKGYIVERRGGPAIVECGCTHTTRGEAFDCVKRQFHCEPGSVTWETLVKNGWKN